MFGRRSKEILVDTPQEKSVRMAPGDTVTFHISGNMGPPWSGTVERRLRFEWDGKKLSLQ